MSVYSSGWLLDDAGIAQCIDLGASAVPTDAVFLNGGAYRYDGARYCTTDAPGTIVYTQGIAQRNDGAMYLTTTTAATDVSLVGWLLTSAGVVIYTITPDASPVFIRGINFTNAGKLVLNFTDPIIDANSRIWDEATGFDRLWDESDIGNVRIWSE